MKRRVHSTFKRDIIHCLEEPQKVIISHGKEREKLCNWIKKKLLGIMIILRKIKISSSIYGNEIFIVVYISQL